MFKLSFMNGSQKISNPQTRTQSDVQVQTEPILSSIIIYFWSRKQTEKCRNENNKYSRVYGFVRYPLLL